MLLLDMSSPRRGHALCSSRSSSGRWCCSSSWGASLPQTRDDPKAHPYLAASGCLTIPHSPCQRACCPIRARRGSLSKKRGRLYNRAPPSWWMSAVVQPLTRCTLREQSRFRRMRFGLVWPSSLQTKPGSSIAIEARSSKVPVWHNDCGRWDTARCRHSRADLPPGRGLVSPSPPDRPSPRLQATFLTVIPRPLPFCALFGILALTVSP
jgi:hypothetical protein